VPLVTGVAPAFTVAVKVICAGETTVPPEATAAPPLVMVSVVVVAVCAKAGRASVATASVISARRQSFTAPETRAAFIAG